MKMHHKAPLLDLETLKLSYREACKAYQSKAHQSAFRIGFQANFIGFRREQNAYDRGAMGFRSAWFTGYDAALTWRAV